MSVLKIAVNSRDHHLGNLDAAITLLEYGDFECPYCGRAHPLIKRLLKEKGTEVHFVFRNFPLRRIHPHAFIAAVAAEAAANQDKYWEMHDLIFENQQNLSEELLLALAENLRLDLQQFAFDCKSAELKDKVEKDFEGGIRSGVNQTPSFYINGQLMTTYDETYESLLEAILIEADS